MQFRARIETRLPCPGLVVIGQTWYPGWTAWVDGNRAPLLEATISLTLSPSPPARMSFN